MKKEIELGRPRKEIPTNVLLLFLCKLGSFLFLASLFKTYLALLSLAIQ
jgi:hypothetical protein